MITSNHKPKSFTPPVEERIEFRIVRNEHGKKVRVKTVVSEPDLGKMALYNLDKMIEAGVSLDNFNVNVSNRLNDQIKGQDFLNELNNQTPSE